jgi:hypothetical protein
MEQFGDYWVDSAGIKRDTDGFIILAVHTDFRGTVPQTSWGIGKCYDARGFATDNYYQLYLATDWSNWDGV